MRQANYNVKQIPPTALNIHPMPGFSHEMLVCGIAAAKVGEVFETRSYLERVIDREEATLDEKCDA
jgi:hypothetical protein